MAGFGDSNDIKISVTVDTEPAINAAKDIGKAFANIAKDIGVDFKTISNAASQFASASAAQVKKGAAEEVAAIKASSAERLAALKAQAAASNAEASREVRLFREKEATKRAEIKLTADQVRLEAAKVRQATAALQSEGAGKSGAIGGLGSGLPDIAAGVYLFKEAIGVVGSLKNAIVGLATEANKVQALSTAFQTLQQSVGRDPAASIERLRTATQGLISDTQLYQKANQAVLLGVPTKLFEESAEAAVKLGRAMGIDATLALESLSIGLGRQSRLYLDNLGIVVSATEAYSNFARENNKLVDDLTDAEKRIAFFNETSKKLKEGLDTLPPLARDAGIAFTELTATQENLTTSFLLGFNNSVELERGLTKLNEASKNLEEPLRRAGEALASFLGKIVTADYIPVIDEMALGLRFLATQAASAADNFFNLSDQAKRTELDNLSKKIANVQNQLRLTKSPLAVGELQASLAAYEAQAKAIEETLAESVRRAQERASFTIKAKVDTTEVKNSLVETESSLTQFKTKTEEALGLIRIPGLDTGKLAALTPEVDNLFRKIEEGGQSAQASAEQVNQLMQAIADEVNATNIETVQGQLAKLREEEAFSLAQSIESSKGLTAEEKAIAEARAVNIANLEAQLLLLQQGIALDQKQREQLEKFFEYRKKLVQSDIKETASQTKKTQTEAQRALEQRKRQIDDFVKGVRRNTKTAIDPKFERQLAELFRGVDADSKEFEDGLRSIAQAALDANTDLSVLSKTIKAQQALLEQGVPKNQLPLSADAAEGAVAYNEELKKAQQGMLNLRELFKGQAGFVDSKQEGGGFFGFDLGTMDPGTEAQLAQQVQDSLASVFQAGADGFTREDVPGISAAAGAAIGAGIAAAFGLDPATGAQIGSLVGSIVGDALSQFGVDTQGTKERKQIDKYFGELFDGGRLTAIIQGNVRTAVSNGVVTIGEEVTAIQPELRRLSDLVFEGFTPFAGQVQFGGENFFNYFNTLSAEIQNSFNGVGVAVGMLQGLSSEQARLIGAALSNNIGGSLQNLQVLVQQTGESFEDLSQAVLKAFRDAQLTAEEAYNALVQLQNIYSEGIPGAIGDFQQAIDNLNTSLKNEQPGQYALDSLRDIGSEGQEAAASFGSVISSLGQTFGFAADQQARLFEALRLSGITSLQQLAKASDEQLLTLIRNINAIKENAAAPLAAVPVIPSTTKTGAGGSRKDPAKELLEKQREEARKLTQESQEYLKIIEQINAGQLSNVQAGKEIKQINAEILQLIKDRDAAEKKLNAELDKGAKGSAEKIAKLSAALAKLQENLEKVKEKAKENTREYKDLDISGIIPLIKSQNTLGLVAKQIGVSLEKNVDILIKGFMQGRLSIKQVNDEINKTKELLGPGIPNSVGAVTDAFQNLIDAGTQGGSFSVDAFTDIFAEFREKFNKEGSAFREAQRKQLNENLDAARRAALVAVGPEATEAARKALDLAKKAIEDFKNTPIAPDLSDLRDQLKNSFSPEQVDLFFQALDESGLKSFEELEGASSQAIIGILGRLQELGFKFGETSDEAKGINQGLQDAETAANAGLDPLKEAIDLVKTFNDSAGLLPPVFNSTTDAIGKMEGPLTKIADKISNTVEKLGKLGGNTFENDIVFNIRTTGEQGGKALVELIFGDGSEASTDTGNGKKTPPKKDAPTKDTPSNDMGKRSDWIRQSPGIYKNRKTGKIVRSRTNPGA